jgi:hypothetical protein
VPTIACDVLDGGYVPPYDGRFACPAFSHRRPSGARDATKRRRFFAPKARTRNPFGLMYQVKWIPGLALRAIPE